MCSHVIHIREGQELQIKAFSSNILPDIVSSSLEILVEQNRMKLFKKKNQIMTYYS